MTVEASGLPAVNQALEPAWVRHGSASTQKTYETALAFEEMLVQQLSQSLTATSGLEGESSQSGETGSEAGGSPSMGTSQLSSLLPQALSTGVMSAGGLGLAAQLTRALEGTQSALPAQAGGGTAPATTVSPAPSATGGVVA
jgi:Rod binding domain-containing protein